MSKRRIAFLIRNIYGVGGIQRVLPEVVNYLSEYYDISIVHTSQGLDGKREIVYPYRRDVKLLFEPELALKKRGFFRKCIVWLRALLNKFNIYSNYLTGELYYPRSVRKKYINYFNEKAFECIIGLQGDASILLAMIQPELNCECIGWAHSTYSAYFETPGKYCFGQQRLLDKYKRNLFKYVVLTRYDAQLYKEKLDLDAINIYNPLTIVCDKKSENDNKILFCGRLLRQTKGLDHLLSIMQNVLNKMPDHQFVVVGDGDDREWLENETKKAGISDRVKFYGDQKNVVPYYTDAAVLTLTSRWEGFGLVVTEAFEAGVPVISFRTEGPSEIINDGVNGILIDNYDTYSFSHELIGLLKDKERRHRMAKAAALRAKDFSIDNIASQWRDLIEDAVAESKE